MATSRDFFESELSSDEEVELGAILAATAIIFSKRKRRTEWTKDWLRERETFGAYSTLLRELLLEDDQEARRFLRMSYENFQFLLARVRPLIEKKDTWMRKAIPAGERLAITLRYLGSGKSSFHFVVSLFIRRVESILS